MSGHSTNCKVNLAEEFQKEEREESMQHVVAGQHRWISKNQPRKFLYLFFKVVICSIIESSFYRQLVIRSETEMREEEKLHPRNVG